MPEHILIDNFMDIDSSVDKIEQIKKGHYNDMFTRSTLKQLKKSKFDIFDKYENGTTFMILACWNEKDDIVNYIIKHFPHKRKSWINYLKQANPYTGSNCLMNLISKNNWFIMDNIFKSLSFDECNDLVCSTDNYGKNIFSFCAMYNNLDAFKYLINFCHDSHKLLREISSTNNDVLDYANNNNSLDVIEYIISNFYPCKKELLTKCEKMYNSSKSSEIESYLNKKIVSLKLEKFEVVKNNVFYITHDKENVDFTKKNLFDNM